MDKSDKVVAAYNGKIYEVVGTWNGIVVFSPIDPLEKECMLYTPGEVSELLENGEFIKVEG